MEAEKLTKLKELLANSNELKCWQFIHFLGEHTFKMEHDFCDGRIKGDDVEAAISENKQTLEIIANTVCEKYKIIPQKDCPIIKNGENLPAAPEGYSYYPDWYKKMKLQNDKEER